MKSGKKALGSAGKQDVMIGHLSDLHLGKPTLGDPNGAERLNSLRHGLARLTQQSVNAILVAGDVFDNPQVEPAVVQAAARAFDSICMIDDKPVPVIVIPGNHDPAEETKLWNDFKGALHQASAVQIILKPTAVVLANGNLVVEGYPCETRYSAEAPWVRRLTIPAGADNAARVIVAHGTLQGGQVPEGESDAFPFKETDLDSLGADYVALGHFHCVYKNWNGEEEVERRYCYSGTHEPDQFDIDGGWVILATVSAGKPTRLRRLQVGRRCWRQLDIASAADLSKIEDLHAEVERDPQPSRFVIRLRVTANTQLSMIQAELLTKIEAALRALGAQVKQNGDFQPTVSLGSLDLKALPSGALKESILDLQQDFVAEQDLARRAVLEAALLMAWNKFQHVR